jgi:hypothetical protein
MPADEDATGHSHQVGGLERTIGDAQRLDRRLDVPDAAREGQDVAAQHFRSGQYWYIDHVPGNPSQMYAACERLVGQLAHRLAAVRLVRHEHVDERCRQIQQRRVVDLRNVRLHVFNEQLARPHDCHAVTWLKDGVGVGVDQGVAAPDSFDEHPQFRKELAHGSAGEPAGQVEAVGAQLDRAIRGHDPRVEADYAPSQLSLVLRASGGQVDPDQLRA